jgi:hypothetical protein
LNMSSSSSLGLFVQDGWSPNHAMSAGRGGASARNLALAPCLGPRSFEHEQRPPSAQIALFSLEHVFLEIFRTLLFKTLGPQITAASAGGGGAHRQSIRRLRGARAPRASSSNNDLLPPQASNSPLHMSSGCSLGIFVQDALALNHSMPAGRGASLSSLTRAVAALSGPQSCKLEQRPSCTPSQ